MIIGTTTLGPSNHTLGLEIVSKEIAKAGFEIRQVSQKEAKNVDVLLVSLYWCDQVFEFPNWLIRAKIDPTKRKPLIILGGSMLMNPNSLKGMFHYAVIGDGEGVAVNLIRAIDSGDDPAEMESVLCGDDIKKNVTGNVAPELPMEHYIELRNNKITRLELARGCKMKCGFCQLTHIKPYREIPPPVLKNLIYTSPTKTIALFSPDRGSYSGYEQIEGWMSKYGKRNMGTDIRLSSLRKTNVATQVRFGVEGFSERERKLVRKPYTNEQIKKDVLHVIHEIKTPKGKPITVITWYMILGLPGQVESDYKDFAELLHSIDGECKGLGNNMTLFLSCSDFMPSNHTPMERYHKDIWTDHSKGWMKHKPFLENITIAGRGGSRGPSTRLAQLLVFRGGENANKALFHLSTNTKYSKLLKDRSNQAGKDMLKMFRGCGVDVSGIVEGYPDAQPWDNIRPF